MNIQIFLNFHGSCREAVEFYAQVFGLEPPKFMTYGDHPSSPDHPLSEQDKKLIMYTELALDGNKIMFSDVPPNSPFTAGNNFTIAITDNDTEKMSVWFNKLKQNGKIEIELGETFFSKCYGMLVDKYGICWQFSHEA